MALVTVQRSPTPDDHVSLDQLLNTSSTSDGGGEQSESGGSECDHEQTACFSPLLDKAHEPFSSIGRSRYFAVKGAAVILSSPGAKRQAGRHAAGRTASGSADCADALPQLAADGRMAHSHNCARPQTQPQPQPQTLANANAGEIQQHLQAMLHLLRPQDTLKMAVRLESMLGTHTRYMAIVCASAADGAGEQQESAACGASSEPAVGCEAALIGIDYVSPNKTTIGLVLPIWANSIIGLDGDGGISVESQSSVTGAAPAAQVPADGGGEYAACTASTSAASSSQSASSSAAVVTSFAHSFKPVSVQAMWSAYQALHREHGGARTRNYFPGGGTHAWLAFYETNVNSPESFRSEWHYDTTCERGADAESAGDGSGSGGDFGADALSRFRPVEPERAALEKAIRGRLKEIMQTVDLDEVTSKDIRERLEARMSRCLREYKPFIDREMLVILGQMDKPSKIFDYLYLGTEWNASNWDELNANGVRYILNVTKEVDNFFPGLFNYMKIRVSDEESAELLKHWDLTYKFVNQARDSGSAVLVHCKKGISRSSSTVIAYAMKEYGWSVDDALAYVKSKRNIITPNKGFVRQLRTYNGILEASRNRNSALFNSAASAAKISVDRDMLAHSASTAGPLVKPPATLNMTPVSSTPHMHCRRVTVSQMPTVHNGNYADGDGLAAHGRQNFPGRLLVASENILKAVPPQQSASDGGEHVTSLEVPGWDDRYDSAPNTACCRPERVPEVPPVSARLPAVSKALQRRESGKRHADDDCTLKRIQSMLVRTKRHSAGSAGAGSSSSGASSLLESDSSLDMSASDDEHRFTQSIGGNVRSRVRARSHNGGDSGHPACVHQPEQRRSGRHRQQQQQCHTAHCQQQQQQRSARHGSKGSVKSVAADSAVADLGVNGSSLDHHVLIRTQSSNSMRAGRSSVRRAGPPLLKAAACAQCRASSMTCLAEEGRAGQYRQVELGDFTPVPGQVKRTAVTYEMRQHNGERRTAQQSPDTSVARATAAPNKSVAKKVNAGRKFFERFFPPKKHADNERQSASNTKWYHDVRKRRPAQHQDVPHALPSASSSVVYHHYQPTPLLAAAQRCATGAMDGSGGVGGRSKARSAPQSSGRRERVLDVLTRPGDRRTFAGDVPPALGQPQQSAGGGRHGSLACCRSDENLVRSLVGVFERSYDATHESLEPPVAQRNVHFTLGDTSQCSTPVKDSARSTRSQSNGDSAAANFGNDLVRATRALTFQ